MKKNKIATKARRHEETNFTTLQLCGKHVYISILSILFIVSLSSCQKEELPIAKYDRGSVTTTQLSLSDDYRYQLWFDLGTNSVIKTNLKTDWDLALDCSDSTHWIYLNSARLMKAAVTEYSSLDSVHSKSGLDFKAEHPGRNIDSIAVGDWVSNSKVYVIDMGYNAAGTQLGYKKILFAGISGNTYSFHYSNLDGSDDHISTVVKDPDYNSIAFSFTENTPLLIEPLKNQFDLCFTQYTYFFFDPYMPYIVTGVLLNKTGVTVARDSVKKFSDISSSDLSNYIFTDSLDAIGYSWKEYNFTTSSYEVFPQKNYIIRDGEGFYYKLHFIDFYNNVGQKGNPKFEFQKL